ncbi:hypothetical protein A2960_04865 [Candidatus Gottesmanbacteria bacterium RIFCSPLOWO2_01_FULL_39_12b]|uniref:Sortase n=1 Tax=Candidatus Gottesmanbacteria bacterium RIFCSPLOWO2_01_FULL_39_12b TaxID=1798388 RepID=A0A1F6ANL0_9BACT|nr:MAG: hypothetical protein A2960_04865 [Candidatus Gottesmanbacteria bacterium RIFCSPLOWO2_01_FULL_39_12b]
MAIYAYAKKTYSVTKKIASVLSIIFILAGISILIWVTYPIVTFELFYSPKFGTTFIRPIPNESVRDEISTQLSQVIGGKNVDFTKASMWFPKATNIKLVTNVTSYQLSIAKLKIENANVVVGSEDLSKSLIHFTGPQPGNFGTPVIFGHSTIPWLYNPKDYKTIFSKLPDLNKGDEILLTYDNISYRYQVFDMRITSPDDLSVLEQNYNSAYLTLVTCVPPGTYLKRLVVKAKLVD